VSISRLMQMGAAGVPSVEKQAVVFVGSSSIAAYEWIPGTGFGSAYSAPGIPSSYDCFFSNNKDAFFVAGASSPYVSAWAWNSNTGFGSALSQPSSPQTLYAYGGGDINSVDSAVVIGGQAGGSGQPEVVAYAFSSSGGFGTKYSNPGSLPGETVRQINFDPTDANVVMGVSGYYGQSVLKYAWSNSSGFGSKTTYTAINFGTCYGIDFHPSGSYAVVTTSGSPYARSYNYSSSGFGSLVSTPSSGPGSETNDPAFNSDGSVVALCEFNSPYVHAYAYSSGSFGTKFSNPSSLPGGFRESVRFSPDDDAIFVGGGGGSTKTDIYNWSNSSGFGSRISTPSAANFRVLQIAVVKG